MFRQLALLLTDIVDSTALNSAIGDAAMADFWAKHDRISRALIRDSRGREIGRSDGFLVAFETVDDAAAFASAYHLALDGFDEPARARVGIHFGDAELRRNTAQDTASGATVYEVDGIALPVAARVSAVAGARQTLITHAAKAALRTTTLTVQSHGHWQLKGMTEPVELFEVGDNRSSFVRPQDGDKAYQVVAERDGWRPSRDIRSSVPAARDAFIGREEDLRRLFDAFAARARLVTVVGVGGVGKTRVAMQFARRWLGDFPGGAWFCDLSEVRDVDGIISAAARGLDVRLKRADPRRQLSEVIRGRGRCLILLDNFEQVARCAAETAGYWLDRAPEACFIATSRERLGVAGEHVIPLAPLGPKDATSLFVSRAGAHHPNIRLDAGDVATVRELVQVLDGLPLAIELAAGRLGVMSPQVMLSRIGHRFTLLSARSGRSQRQSTLRAAFDWSWELLTANERAALAQASVFRGGFTLAAAESVLRLADASDGAVVVDTLQSLADKSFIQADGARFNLLVSVREYAEQKLTARDTADAEHRHASFFAVRLDGDTTASAVELDNILAAARRAISRRDGDIAARSLANAWLMVEVGGPYQLPIELVEAALAIDGASDRERIRLTYIHGRRLLVSGDAGRARTQLTRANADARRAQIRVEEIRALASLAELDLVEGRVDDARRQYEEAISGAAELGHLALHCASLIGMGAYYNRVGEFEAARGRFREALQVARTSNQRHWEDAALGNLGNVEWYLGNRAAAKAHYDQAIALAQQMNDRVRQADLLCNLGLFRLEDGDTVAAEEHLDRALALARENGLSLVESVVLCNMGLLHEAKQDMRSAEDAYRSALDVARRRGDRRSEGQFLGYLGLLVAKRGEAAQARACLADGIEILRKVKDRLSLGIVLCRYAEAATHWGDVAGAGTCLQEAEAIAGELHVSPESELAASLQRARRSLAALQGR